MLSKELKKIARDLQGRKVRRVAQTYSEEDYLHDLWKDMGNVIYLMDQSHTLAPISDAAFENVMEAKELVEKALRIIETIELVHTPV